MTNNMMHAINTVFFGFGFIITVNCVSGMYFSIKIHDILYKKHLDFSIVYGQFSQREKFLYPIAEMFSLFSLPKRSAKFNNKFFNGILWIYYYVILIGSISVLFICLILLNIIELMLIVFISVVLIFISRYIYTNCLYIIKKL
jgi:hypothetical protein